VTTLRISSFVLVLSAFTRASTGTEPLRIDTLDLPAGIAGREYEASLSGTGGAGAGYWWRAAGLPEGLRLEAPTVCPERGGLVEAGALDASLGPPRLRAVSGLESSRRNPGVFWAHDDADSSLPEIYALAGDGSHLRTYLLSTHAVDWEDIALGPGPEAGKDYLYMGDFGDNTRSRPYAWLLRVLEPVVTPGPEALPLAAEHVYFRYPDGARDIETLLIDPATGTPYIAERNDAGCRAYSFPMPLDPGRGTGDPVVVRLVTPSASLPATLTAGDVSPDGRRMVLRNYTTAFEYLRPEGAPFETIFFTDPCAVFPAGNQQYEGICYGPDGVTLYTTTERAGRDRSPILSWVATPSPATATLRGSLPGSPGEYRVTIELGDGSGAVVESTLTLTVLGTSPPGLLPGDCNESGAVDIADAICLLDRLFGVGWIPLCEPSSEPAATSRILDWNGDGEVDLSDAVALLMRLFSGGSAHAQGESCVNVEGCSDICTV